MSRIRNIALSLGRAVSLVLLVGIITLIFIQVVSRFAFGTSIVWASELARYSYVWLVFLGAVFVAQERAHIRVVLLKDKLRPRLLETAINAVGPLVVIASCIVLVFGGFEWAIMESAGVSAALELPMNVMYGLLILAFVGIGLMSTRDLFQLFGSKRSSEIGPKSAEAPERVPKSAAEGVTL